MTNNIMDIPPQDWTLELYRQISLPPDFHIEFVPNSQEFHVEIRHGKLKVVPKFIQGHYRFTLDKGFTWFICSFDDLPDVVKATWKKLSELGIEAIQ